MKQKKQRKKYRPVPVGEVIPAGAQYKSNSGWKLTTQAVHRVPSHMAGEYRVEVTSERSEVSVRSGSVPSPLVRLKKSCRSRTVGGQPDTEAVKDGLSRRLSEPLTLANLRREDSLVLGSVVVGFRTVCYQTDDSTIGRRLVEELKKRGFGVFKL